MKNLTLEERERLAYITNSPDHAMVALALEAAEEADDELRHERDVAEGDLKDANAKVDELEQDLEKAETDLAAVNGLLEDAQIKVADLEEKIHLAGVDLV